MEAFDAQRFGPGSSSKPFFRFGVLAAEVTKGDGEPRDCPFDWPNTLGAGIPVGFEAGAKGLAEPAADANGLADGALL